MPNPYAQQGGYSPRFEYGPSSGNGFDGRRSQGYGSSPGGHSNSPVDYGNSTGYVSGYVSGYGRGSMNGYDGGSDDHHDGYEQEEYYDGYQAGYGRAMPAPPKPPKVPMGQAQGYGVSALSKEMANIDIGGSRQTAPTRRTRFG